LCTPGAHRSQVQVLLYRYYYNTAVPGVPAAGGRLLASHDETDFQDFLDFLLDGRRCTSTLSAGASAVARFDFSSKNVCIPFQNIRIIT
jgi:hypothetical protein